MWWHGPRWLSQHRMKWPKEPAELDKNDKTVMSEQKTIKALTTQVNEEGIERVIDPFRYNSYKRLIRVTTYCLRFTRNVQLPLTEREVDTNLSIAELWAAETDGLLRAGGRLRQSTLPPESKHPILLPSHHPVVELLIRNQHIRQLHASVNQTLVAIRTRFWIIKARNTVKKVIRPCPICRRINAQPYQPVERAEESAPFSHTGVDFAGPLYTRSDTRARNPSTNKTYISVFTCMVTRAVHLEIVREQTASCFLNALRRFISRRGRPRVIQSDNFRSFKLANEFLRRLFHSAEWNEVQSKLNEERTERFLNKRLSWGQSRQRWPKTPQLRQLSSLLAGRTAVGSCLSSFRESLPTSRIKALMDWATSLWITGVQLPALVEIFFRPHDLTDQLLSFRKVVPPAKRATRSRSDTPALRPTSATSWAYCLMVWPSRRGTARSAIMLTPPGHMCPAIAS
ncbi:hypothetical protein T12_10557 [Trichinella patagoniensis]|uniref:Integrase zinc-binding domain-containing protein n=1 Tax=Trichinella patagoniensis TaxID=990121 RepID=A0A0V1AG98_9BILA|nr:hypothetical protein T12_10557 [Trichinella patagoniensis]